MALMYRNVNLVIYCGVISTFTLVLIIWSFFSRSSVLVRVLKDKRTHKLVELNILFLHKMFWLISFPWNVDFFHQLLIICYTTNQNQMIIIFRSWYLWLNPPKSYTLNDSNKTKPLSRNRLYTVDNYAAYTWHVPYTVHAHTTEESVMYALLYSISTHINTTIHVHNIYIVNLLN